jgi:hypothetical protein
MTKSHCSGRHGRRGERNGGSQCQNFPVHRNSPFLAAPIARA